MSKIQEFIKRNKIPILVAVAGPVLINYLLFTWRAPYLMGETSDWFTFLGSYLGFIGAVYIALFQMKSQKDIEKQREVVASRSYAIVQDFGATLMLVGAKTHENSRIIKTSGFEWLMKGISETKYKSTRVGYLKISHHGGSEVIYNCELNVSLEHETDGHKGIDGYNINIGAIEKGTEVFFPLVPVGIRPGNSIELEYATFEYSTIVGERLKLILDYENSRERLVVVVNKEEVDVIYDIDLKKIGWVFPNKIDQQ